MNGSASTPEHDATYRSRATVSNCEALLAKFPEIDKSRVEAVGRGWQEPTPSTDPAQNRRVEVQWFTIE